LRTGSIAWLISIGAWVFLFLFFYLFYFPARWRSISLRVRERSVCMRRGVFYQVSSVMPLSTVRFTRVLRGPVARMFGFCTLHIAASGGDIFMPGLTGDDARRLGERIS
jgi:membrane protein YdbS with pleckstrin-like domain